MISIQFVSIFAAVDCIDNSWYMEREIDLKEYHYVQCNCPCGKYTRSEMFNILPDRNRCFKCGHFHDAKPLPIEHKLTIETANDINQVDHMQTTTIVRPYSRQHIHPLGKQLRAIFDRIKS
jgi:hypothetical protein